MSLNFPHTCVVLQQTTYQKLGLIYLNQKPPVTTVNEFLFMSTSTFLRLCCSGASDGYHILVFGLSHLRNAKERKMARILFD